MYKQLKRIEKIFILIYAFFCTFVPLNHTQHYEHELVTVRLDKTPKYDKKPNFHHHSISFLFLQHAKGNTTTNLHEALTVALDQTRPS